MAPHDDLLHSICHSEETLSAAQSILHSALHKTRPGSGYELGPHKTGLPAICAYIASSRLNNTEVTRKNAQIASCLKAIDFDKTLDTVQAAIGGTRRTRGRGVMYETLLQQYGPTLDHQQFKEWTATAKRALLQSDSRFGDDSDVPELKYAIFYWTFNVATGKNPGTQQDFAAEHCVPAKLLTKYLTKMNSSCSSLKTRIQNDVKEKHSPTKASVTHTPRRTPKKPARILPSRDSPTKRKVAEPPVQSESDDEMIFPETPSKKRKTKSPEKPAIGSSIKSAFPSVASSPRVSPRALFHQEAQPMDVDTIAIYPLQEESEEEEMAVRRRFRPVYLDHKEWYSADKRVKRLWRQAEQYKNMMVELHGHPFTIIPT